MNSPLYPRYILFLLLTLVFSSTVNAQSRDSYEFVILSGEVTVTPAFCPPDACESKTLPLAGGFVAFLPGGATQLFFTSSSVITKPDISFELPTDPNEDSGGVSRMAEHHFDGEILSVSGFIDSRAFDGPLMEYDFSARVTATSNANKLLYYTARPDLRKCISPLCGGYFVKAVNKKLTRCADGTRQKECYVTAISPAVNGAAGLGLNTPLLLLGEIVPQKQAEFGDLGLFKAKEVQLSATSTTAKGRFYGTENNGIVCITDPCFSYDRQLLNRKRSAAISQISFAQSDADKSQIEAAKNRLANGETLFASGFTRKYEGMAGQVKEFVIQQFYLPGIKPVTCEEGYTFTDKACRTAYGCAYPKLELTAYSGVAVADPVTGELSSEIQKTCVDSCELPAVFEESGHCSVYYP